MNRNKRAWLGVTHQHDRGQWKTQQHAEEHDLDRGVGGPERLDEDVVCRKQSEGNQGQQRAFDIRRHGWPLLFVYRLASSAATMASPISDVDIGVPSSGPIRSAVRAPSARTASIAASRRAASSPWSKE